MRAALICLHTSYAMAYSAGPSPRPAPQAKYEKLL
jgi:hypothetical protein